MVSSRTLADLATAYREYGVAAAYDRHCLALRTRAWYRLAFGTIDIIVPLTGIARLLANLERRIGEVGLHAAGEGFIADLGWPRKVTTAASSASTLAGGPTVFYSNHASLLTPALFYALLPRTDIKIIAHRLVAGCGPNMARYLIPVRSRSQGTWLKRLTGGPPEIVPYLADKWLEPGLTPELAKRANVEALQAAAQHVAAGGCVVIAPDGGAYNGRTWFPGLGRLILQIAHSAPGQAIQLVPVNVRNADDARLLGTVSRNPLLRRQAGRWEGVPVELVFNEAMTAERAIAEGGAEPVALVNFLQRNYEEQFPLDGVSTDSSRPVAVRQ
jgi:hypothetical protein